MPEVMYTGTFRGWLDGLRDGAGRARVLVRIRRLEAGNPGDHKGVGNGVMELRITFGPGYRVYYKPYGSTVLVLLAGGDKSTQASDVAKAKALALEWERNDG